jgi:hypothetical protein
VSRYHAGMETDRWLSVVSTVYPLVILIIAVELRGFTRLSSTKKLWRSKFGAVALLIARIAGFVGIGAALAGLAGILSFVSRRGGEVSDLALTSFGVFNWLIFAGVLFPIAAIGADGMNEAQSGLKDAFESKKKGKSAK